MSFVERVLLVRRSARVILLLRSTVLEVRVRRSAEFELDPVVDVGVFLSLLGVLAAAFATDNDEQDHPQNGKETVYSTDAHWKGPACQHNATSCGSLPGEGGSLSPQADDQWDSRRLERTDVLFAHVHVRTRVLAFFSFPKPHDVLILPFSFLRYVSFGSCLSAPCLLAAPFPR